MLLNISSFHTSSSRFTTMCTHQARLGVYERIRFYLMLYLYYIAPHLSNFLILYLEQPSIDLYKETLEKQTQLNYTRTPGSSRFGMGLGYIYVHGMVYGMSSNKRETSLYKLIL